MCVRKWFYYKEEESERDKKCLTDVKPHSSEIHVNKYSNNFRNWLLHWCTLLIIVEALWLGIVIDKKKLFEKRDTHLNVLLKSENVYFQLYVAQQRTQLTRTSNFDKMNLCSRNFCFTM